MSNFMLQHKLKSLNEFAEIEPVDIGKDIMEKTKSKAKHVYYIFSSLVVDMVLFSNVMGSCIKGMGEKSSSLLNCMTMSFPALIILEHCPIPGVFVVCSEASDLASPEIEQEVTDVSSKVHDISSHAKRDT